ncbi:MAG: hypothetical protein K5765_08955 [Clostridia bacterium]|nr:hypothetical protein [Clostridia bacterium]
MKKKNDVNYEVETVTPGNGFKDYLKFNNNIEALEYMEEQEKAGHFLPVKGKGTICYVVVDSIYSYDIFRKDENKELYGYLLQAASNQGQSVALLCYTIINNSAHIIIKGDNKKIILGFIELVNVRFASQYQACKEPLGYPFRLDKDVTVISSNELFSKMCYVYGLSPIPFNQYPYNSLSYILQGNSIANMIIGVELDIIRQQDYLDMLIAHTSQTRYLSKGVEKFKKVFNEQKKIYFDDTITVRESVLGFCITEAAARTQTPYGKVAKVYNINVKRHDLLVSSLADFIVRRECGYFEAIRLLGLGESFDSRLIIETFVEVHRLTRMPYTYIINNIMNIEDKDYQLLANTFIALHRDRGMNFAELCEDYYITKDIAKIKLMCNFD